MTPKVDHRSARRYRSPVGPVADRVPGDGAHRASSAIDGTGGQASCGDRSTGLRRGAGELPNRARIWLSLGAHSRRALDPVSLALPAALLGGAAVQCMPGLIVGGV